MPGRPSDHPAMRYVGAAFAVVAAVGVAVYGWEFGSGDPVPTALGVAAVLVAVGYTVLRR